MKILILTHSTKRHGPAELLEEYLIEIGHQVYKLEHPLENYNEMSTSLYSNGVLTKRLKRLNLGIFSLLRDIIINAFEQYKIKPQIIFGANNFDTFSGILMKKIRILKMQRVIYFASDLSEDRFKNRLLNKAYLAIEKWVLKNADLVISNTHRAETRRIELGLNKKDSIVIPNGVRVVGNIVNKRINFRKFVYVGSVSETHGLFDVIKCAHNLMDELVIIGNGSDLQRVINVCKKFNLDLTLYKDKDQEFVLDFLRSFNGVGLAPYNRLEKWTKYCSPLKVVEYLINGVVPLISDVPEISEYISKNQLGLVYNNYSEIPDLLKNAKSDYYANIAQISRDHFNATILFKAIPGI